MVVLSSIRSSEEPLWQGDPPEGSEEGALLV